MSTTSDRLRELMNMRGLKQVDILRLAEPYCKRYNIKLQKSDLSQFVNGLVQPGQSKLSILGMALNVSEAWLMGLPVPMDRIEEGSDPWSTKFRESLQELIISADEIDAHDSGIDLSKWRDIAYGAAPLSLEACCNVCDEAGESLDEMTGLREKKTAESICGLDEQSIMMAWIIQKLPPDLKQAALQYLKFLEYQSGN